MRDRKNDNRPTQHEAPAPDSAPFAAGNWDENEDRRDPLPVDRSYRCDGEYVGEFTLLT